MAQKAPGPTDIAWTDEDDLDASLSRFEATSLENELQAYSFCQQQLREFEAQERLDRTENMTTEVLELVTSPAVGAISTLRTKRNFPIGALLNYLVGVGAKGVSIMSPEHRGLRVLGKVGKVLLHGQLAITTRDLINE